MQSRRSAHDRAQHPHRSAHQPAGDPPHATGPPISRKSPPRLKDQPSGAADPRTH
jgi:hypothetical protein